MTKKEMFAMIATVNADNAEIVDFCNHEIELLNKKGSSGKKSLTKVQKENEVLKDIILHVLIESDSQMTVSEIIKSSEELSELSNQKVSALLRQLVETGEVEKIMEKKKAYFVAVK